MKTWCWYPYPIIVYRVCHLVVCLQAMRVQVLLLVPRSHVIYCIIKVEQYNLTAVLLYSISTVVLGGCEPLYNCSVPRLHRAINSRLQHIYILLIHQDTNGVKKLFKSLYDMSLNDIINSRDQVTQYLPCKVCFLELPIPRPMQISIYTQSFTTLKNK